MRIAGIIILFVCTLFAQAGPAPTAGSMDRDLMEVTVPKLEQMYAAHRYTVAQVVRWYIARIRRYDPVYGPVEYLNARAALARAARLDADFAAHPNLSRGLLWGVPIVIKENTS